MPAPRQSKQPRRILLLTLVIVFLIFAGQTAAPSGAQAAEAQTSVPAVPYFPTMGDTHIPALGDTVAAA